MTTTAPTFLSGQRGRNLPGVEGRPEITGWEALRQARTGAGAFDDAVTILLAEIAEYPRDGHRREWLATVSLHADRDEECVAATDAAIELDPSRPRLYLVRSKALTALGRHDDRRAAAERSGRPRPRIGRRLGSARRRVP